MVYDIFGNSNEKGLIHATHKEFDEKLLILQKRWNNLEIVYRPNPTVFKWFSTPVIRENMRSELLQNLQIEDEKYTQNNSESLNALVKRYVSFQKQDVLQFVNDLEECVCEQQNEVSKAIIGLGRWSLSSPYSHLIQDASCLLKSVDRESLLHPTLQVDRSPDPKTFTSSLSLQFDQSTSKENLADIDCDTCLSVPFTLITDSLSEGLAKAIWKKAICLLKDKKVIKAP